MHVVIIGASGAIGGAFLDHYLSIPNCRITACARLPCSQWPKSVNAVSIDLLSEDTIELAAQRSEQNGPIDQLLICSGLLHSDSIAPEKHLAQLNFNTMRSVFDVNTLGPLLCIKHFASRMRQNVITHIGVLSARVGSLADNRLGGWYSYRASKAALNMMLKCAAIELSRKNKKLVLCGLHPGTVDSDLSAPFQTRVPSSQLKTPKESVACLLRVLEQRRPDDSGFVFAWDGQRIPY